MPISFGVGGKVNRQSKSLLPASLPKNGLLVYLDAANPNSYPGAGDKWFDLSGNNKHATLYNNVIYDKNISGGVLRFTTGNTANGLTVSYIDTQCPNLSNSNYTVITATRYTDLVNDRQRIVSASGNNWLMGHWNGVQNAYFAEGWVSTYSPQNPGVSWNIYAATGDITNDQYQLFINNSQSFSNSGGSKGPNGLVLGRGSIAQGVDVGTAGEPSKGEVSFLLVYNRVLSAQELTDVYNIFKTRFSVYGSNLKTHYDLSDSACYPGSGTSLTDLSGNSATGTLVNGTVVESKVLKFDGTNDYVSFAKPSWLTTGASFSVSFWAKWTTTGTTTSTIQALIDNNHGSSPAQGFVIQDRPDLSKSIQFSVQPNTNGVVSTFQVGDGCWHHIVGTYDGTTTKLYIDGSLNGSIAQTASPVQTTITLGTWQTGPARFLNGRMSNFQMFSSALSASDISQIYSASKSQFFPADLPGSISGLQAWLKADSGVYDASGNLITTDNTAVAVWEDQSEKRTTFTQSTATSRPLLRTGANGVNGLPALLFDGTDDELFAAINPTPTSNFSYFAVIKPLTKTGYGFNSRFCGRISGATGFNWGCTTTNFYAVIRDNAGTGPDISWGSSQIFDSPILSSVIMNSSETSLRINKNKIGSSTRTYWQTGGTTEYIGSDGVTTSSRFQGYICEILIFNRALSNKELSMVESYLASKWGITKAIQKENDGLVASWDAGNVSSYSGSGTALNDLTGNGNHAVLTNTPVYFSDNGGHLKFRKSKLQYAPVSTLTNIPSGNSSVTIEVLYNHGGVDSAGLVGWGTYASLRQVHALRTRNTNDLRFYGWGADLDVVAAMTPGSWYHIVAIYNANTATKEVWVNGVLLGVQTGQLEHNVTANNLTFGKTFDTESCEGSLKFVKIYNRPISSDEIAVKYRAVTGLGLKTIPTNAPGLSVWFKADSGVLDASNNAITVNNTNVATWNDLSGNGYHATQATAANMLLYRNSANGQNGLPAIYSDGTNRWLGRTQTLFTTAVSYFLVCQFDDTTGRYWPFDAAGYYPYHFAVEQHNNLNRVAFFGGSNSWVTSMSPIAGAQVFSVLANTVSGATISINTDVTFRRNRTTMSLSSNGQNSLTWPDYSSVTGQGFSIGRPTTLNQLMMKGKIYEIIVFNRVLSTTERDNIETYLMNKWGIV